MCCCVAQRLHSVLRWELRIALVLKPDWERPGILGSAWGMPGSRPDSGDSGRAEPAGRAGGRGLLCARSQYSTVDVPEQGMDQVARLHSVGKAGKPEVQEKQEQACHFRKHRGRLKGDQSECSSVRRRK
ncbi:unnamed protein product [Eretmochelys imbricata]